MMFAQANSEHCRHKIFNASWTIDGEARAETLFGMIKATHAAAPQGTVVAYSDNAAVVEGRVVSRFHPRSDHAAGAVAVDYAPRDELTHTVFKVETHNHPTAISPFPGAATGAGGEIRDEGATGRGAKPKAGLCGFSVSNLRLPGMRLPWENDADVAQPGATGGADYGFPGRIADALAIMIDGPIGAAAFNNEFGRPNLLGYFRAYEQNVGGRRYGYHKPIMIAGGVGNIRDDQVRKLDLPPGTLLVQLGGPGMRIGLGGGAASSMGAGTNTEQLDFDSVQRGNPEIERRAQEVHRPLLGARRRQPGAVDPRRRRRRLVERVPGTGGPVASRSPHRARPHPGRGERHEPARDLVQRIAGALRAGDRARPPARLRVALPARALPVRGDRRGLGRRQPRRRTAGRHDRRSTCRWRCCSASRRACTAT